MFVVFISNVMQWSCRYIGIYFHLHIASISLFAAPDGFRPLLLRLVISDGGLTDPYPGLGSWSSACRHCFHATIDWLLYRSRRKSSGCPGREGIALRSSCRRGARRPSMSDNSRSYSIFGSLKWCRRSCQLSSGLEDIAIGRNWQGMLRGTSIWRTAGQAIGTRRTAGGKLPRLD